MITPIQSRTKEPAANMAGIPQGYDLMDRSVPPEPTHLDSVRLDSSKFLKPANPYPNAGKVTSCINFSAWTPSEIASFIPSLRKMAEIAPGCYVFGAITLPHDKVAQTQFWRIAGFSPDLAAQLAENAPMKTVTQDDDDEPTSAELAETEKDIA